MRINFLPKQGKFFEQFSQQADLICQAAEILKEILQNYTVINFSEKIEKLNELEHKGDDIVHEIAVSVSKTFITPIDREDIHQLGMCLDDVLDFIHGSVIRIGLFNIKEIDQEAVKLAEVIEKSAYLIKKGINLFPKFSNQICDLRKEMTNLERQGDDINRKSIARLFNDESLPVLYVIKWKEIINHLETVSDKCEDVFDILEQVVLKHA